MNGAEVEVGGRKVGRTAFGAIEVDIFALGAVAF